MKIKRSIFLFLAVAGSLLAMQSCDKCTESGTVTISGDAQKFSITYLANDSVNTNYVDSIYNTSNVNMFLNTNGGKGGYSTLTDDLSDGKIGPFSYTNSPTRAQMGVPYDYVYIIQKDTFGIDTFRVEFLATVDECKEYWSQINYYRNGTLMAEYQGQEIADIVIIE